VACGWSLKPKDTGRNAISIKQVHYPLVEGGVGRWKMASVMFFWKQEILLDVYENILVCDNEQGNSFMWTAG